MKSFGTYISKHLASFAAFLLILVIVNVVLYGVTFYHTEKRPRTPCLS